MAEDGVSYCNELITVLGASDSDLVDMETIADNEVQLAKQRHDVFDKIKDDIHGTVLPSCDM